MVRGQDGDAKDPQDSFFSVPVIVGDSVLACSAFGRVYAVKVDSGREKWVFDLEQVEGRPTERAGRRLLISTSAAVADGVICFGTDTGTVYAIR
jgi:outer membrane protein assembly factor BamB